MKRITLILILACIVVTCQKKKTGSQNEAKNNAPDVVDPLVSDSTMYQKYALTVFKNHIDQQLSVGDSALFFKKYQFKIVENTPAKNLLMRFEGCTIKSDLLNLGQDFDLLEKINWYEEAIEHRDLYYQKDDFIVIFEYLKYCESFIPEDYYLYDIRIYRAADYFDLAKDSYSIKFGLKPLFKK